MFDYYLFPRTYNISLSVMVHIIQKSIIKRNLKAAP